MSNLPLCLVSVGRRDFLKKAAVGGAALALPMAFGFRQSNPPAGKRIGIIGLDTSHSTAFTKALNAPDANPAFMGYKIVAAYPYGSRDIESSAKRIPDYSEEVKKYGVEIVPSIKDLLAKVDVVMLETNDGRLHLEQATDVMKAGKRLFIDKPIAASLSDTVTIFARAKQYKVPVFSASSLRYMTGIEKVNKADVLGADTYSPAVLEKTHPDLYWYGVHGVEALFTVMGTGCQEVVRIHTDSTDVVVGTWADGRIGTFRGTRSGQHGYGGIAFTKTGNVMLGPYGGYDPLLLQIIKFFESGAAPVSPAETIEIFTFMEAADESKRQGGKAVRLADVLKKANG